MTDPLLPRRRFLHRSARHGAHWAALAGGAGWMPLTTLARSEPEPPALARILGFAHTHTGERLQLAYAQGLRYFDDAVAALNRLLRDHYTGEVGRMDPQLFDLLHRLRHALGAAASFEVISAYRSPATNARLRQTRGGGVARHSLHMDGRAIDVRLPGVALADLRDAARELRAGGVGFYPRENFVHIDTGPVRHW